MVGNNSSAGRGCLAAIRLPKFGTFATGVEDDVQIRVGITPETQKGVVFLACRRRVVVEYGDTREPEMGECVERRCRHFAAMVQDLPELHGRGARVLQLQVRLASKVRRPEFGGWRVVVALDGLELRDRTGGVPR